MSHSRWPNDTAAFGPREAICQYMKLTTLEKLRDSLRLGIHEIDVPAAVAAKARLALERMIAIS
jgi:quinolinate synthase